VQCCYAVNSKNRMPNALYGHIMLNGILYTFLVCECVAYDNVVVWFLFVNSFEMVNAVTQGNQIMVSLLCNVEMVHFLCTTLHVALHGTATEGFYKLFNVIFFLYCFAYHKNPYFLRLSIDFLIT